MKSIFDFDFRLGRPNYPCVIDSLCSLLPIQRDVFSQQEGRARNWSNQKTIRPVHRLGWKTIRPVFRPKRKEIRTGADWPSLNRMKADLIEIGRLNLTRKEADSAETDSEWNRHGRGGRDIQRHAWRTKMEGWTRAWRKPVKCRCRNVTSSPFT